MTTPCLIADKYGVTNLKERAKEKFEKIIVTCWEMDDFPWPLLKCIQARGLQDPLIRTALNHIDHL